MNTWTLMTYIKLKMSISTFSPVFLALESSFSPFSSSSPATFSSSSDWIQSSAGEATEALAGSQLVLGPSSVWQSAGVRFGEWPYTRYQRKEWTTRNRGIFGWKPIFFPSPRTANTEKEKKKCTGLNNNKKTGTQIYLELTTEGSWYRVQKINFSPWEQSTGSSHSLYLSYSQQITGILNYMGREVLNCCSSTCK